MAKKISKSTRKKTAAKKTAARKSAAKKTPAGKGAKKSATKKTAAKKKKAAATTKSAKKSTAKKATPKKTSVKKAAAKSTGKKADAKAKSGGSKTETKSSSKKAAVARSKGADKKATPIVFSLDDVEALVKSKSATKESEAPKSANASGARASKQPAKSVAIDQPAEKRKHGAASLADILGFSPGAKKKDTHLEEDDIPKKWKKYYKLLIELRQHVREELDLHTADTLKHSSRDDSGDLAGYGNHQADAGTDTFDRDFALSLVSSEQDALNEIEEAILRIKNGSYGTCEVTGEPISKARLTAVPFARFSVEGQAEYEKNKRRKSDRAAGGLFGDSADAPKLASDDDED